MKKALAINLRKLRISEGFTQDHMARRLNWNMRTYQAYEEGRAEPSAQRIVQVADFFGVTNLRAFISDLDYDPNNEHPEIITIPKEPSLQANYRRLCPRDKHIVDILLGIQPIE